MKHLDVIEDSRYSQIPWDQLKRDMLKVKYGDRHTPPIVLNDYNRMPKRKRQDNQNPLTNTRNFGTGNSNGSRIRVPSKKHKNRYKNFLKLFPGYE